ncbi:hypothetical protein BH24CHL1_BH24CHL1_08660 [soil metagenome]
MSVVDNYKRQDVLRAVRAVLAEDCACAEDAFLKDGVSIVDWEERPGRRRFPLPSQTLLVVTMGAGVVVASHPERSAWLRETLQGLERDVAFAASTIASLAQYVNRDGQELFGPYPKYVCSRESFKPADVPDDIQISMIEREGMIDLYRHAGFKHALQYRMDDPRPDMVATVATRGGEIVGIAGADSTCETMWELGIDVVGAARGKGIGQALVSVLTETVLERGRVPHYSAAISNIRSRNVAVSLGYWPAWTELYVQDRTS